MTITKRLRFEILRRDGHRCRYCGAAPDDVCLTIDHVLPRSLGGDDTPSNLVTSCADCNAGKASSHPESGYVAEVSREALGRLAREMFAEHEFNIIAETVVAPLAHEFGGDRLLCRLIDDRLRVAVERAYEVFVSAVLDGEHPNEHALVLGQDECAVQMRPALEAVAAARRRLAREGDSQSWQPDPCGVW
jgi:hypothetical protein